jgi:dipeptidyl aminopeptidase/acylaminoacyl peptidase
MSKSERARPRARLHRDNQQWAFDKIISDTGRVFHFQQKGRGRFPETVRTHSQISKHVGSRAMHAEELAKAEEAAGHDVTALEFYFEAASAYATAQHTIFVLDDEKRFLNEALLRCYDGVRRLAPYPIEHVHVPWQDTTVSGYLHLADVDGPAPLIFYIPGCDMTKELSPHPLYNFATQREMHLFVFDGPGQGESNIRGIKLTVDNYEDAATTALTHLLEQPEVDGDRIGLYSLSFGSYWGARFAATDKRIDAAALVWASICDKYHLFEEESPRYKQLFAFLTGAENEDELNSFRDQMGLEDLLPEIECPTLVTVGQYDPRSPVEEVYELYDSMQAPRELWVYEDQHHNVNLRQNYASQWMGDHHSTTMDWLADRLVGKPVAEPGVTKWLAPRGLSPNDSNVPTKRHWFA